MNLKKLPPFRVFRIAKNTQKCNKELIRTWEKWLNIFSDFCALYIKA